MKIKQTIRNVLSAVLVVTAVTFASLSLTLPVSADCDPNTQSCCGGVETSLLTCTQDGTGSDVNNTGVWGILLFALNILTAGVGVAALGGVVYGAILYISAGGSQDQVKKAIGVFTNVAIGVVAFAAMYAVLNFLVPGGLFNVNKTGTTNSSNQTPTNSTNGGTTNTNGSTTNGTGTNGSTSGSGTSTGAGTTTTPTTTTNASGRGGDDSKSRGGSF